MTVGHWMALNTKRLAFAGISSARLDCFILLEQRLPHGRANILAHLEDTLTDEVLQKLDKDIQLRLQHKPVPYITGYSEFYGRQFIVSDDVLVPRPESESIITLLKKAESTEIIIDVGTGSGCLAITAKLELSTNTVIAVDIDPECLNIAKHNAKKLNADILFHKSNLLHDLPRTLLQQPSIILANLPYVPDTMEVNKPAKHEPGLALYGGPDGLDLYRTLFMQASKLDQKPQAIICESLKTQHHELATIARRNGYVLEKTDGLAQLFIFVNH